MLATVKPTVIPSGENDPVTDEETTMTEMPLTELEPMFLRILDDTHYQRTREMEGADGVTFLCPGCYQKNGGKVGTESVICWRPHVGADRKPGPGRWDFEGTGVNDLTLRGVTSDSVLTKSCETKAHYFVRAGKIVPA